MAPVINQHFQQFGPVNTRVFCLKKSNHFFMHDRIDVRNKWVQFARNYDLTPSVADVYWKIEWTKEI